MTNTDKAFFGHPLGLAILFFTELWERFSYYGMRAILVLFLTSQVNGGFGWTNNQALDLYGWYTMLVYVMSIPGGIIADRFWGQKRTVMVGGGLLVIGHLMLAIPSKVAFFTGLAFIVLGVGGLKPNISTMVGGLYRKGDVRRDTGFTIFYIGINTGSFLASIIVSAVGETYGWHYGFSLAGLGMLAGQLVFIFGQKYLKGIGEEIAAKEEVSAQNTVEAIPEKRELTGQEKDRILAIWISLVIVLVFWMAFEQAGGLMNLYTKAYTNRDFFGWFVIPTGVFQALNAGFIMIFGGIVAAFWDSFVRRGKHIGGIFKMGIGTIIMGLGFIFMVAASQETKVVTLAEKGKKPVEIAIPQNELLAMEKAEIKGKMIWKMTASGNLKFAEKQEVRIAPESLVQVLNQKGKKENVNEMSLFSFPSGKDTVYFASEVTKIKLLAENPTLASDNQQVALTVIGPSKEIKDPVRVPIIKSAMIWLVLAYLFHTLGELCLSPVSLSFITKVSPKHMVATMMGIYWAVIGFGNKLAAEVGKYAETLGEYTVFLGLVIFTVIMGGLLVLFSGQISKLTHGTEEVDLEKGEKENILEKS